jgi:hypothetical protein
VRQRLTATRRSPGLCGRNSTTGIVVPWTPPRPLIWAARLPTQDSSRLSKVRIRRLLSAHGEVHAVPGRGQWAVAVGCGPWTGRSRAARAPGRLKHHDTTGGQAGVACGAQPDTPVPGAAGCPSRWYVRAVRTDRPVAHTHPDDGVRRGRAGCRGVRGMRRSRAPAPSSRPRPDGAPSTSIGGNERTR